MRQGASVAALLMVACVFEIPEDEFPDVAAAAWCDRVGECTSPFETEEDREDCESFWSGTAEFLVDLGELAGADYNPSAGAACIVEIRGFTCAEFNSQTEIPCDVFAEDE